MKIIEALKLIKDLSRKADDLVQKVRNHSADMDYEQAIYPDQKGQIEAWVQAHKDILQNISRLRYAIAKTNINTNVTITIGDNNITKSIQEWISRRKDLAKMELQIWESMTDRGLKDGRAQQSTGQIIDVKVRRYYDPVKKDKNTSLLKSEPSLIDSKLEIVNATTDIVDI